MEIGLQKFILELEENGKPVPEIDMRDIVHAIQLFERYPKLMDHIDKEQLERFAAVTMSVRLQMKDEDMYGFRFI